MLLRSALLLEKLLHPRPPLIRLSLSCSSETVVRKRPKQEMASKRTQPAWEAPNPGEIPRLKLFNSLTREKEVFVPQQGKKVENISIRLQIFLPPAFYRSLGITVAPLCMMLLTWDMRGIIFHLTFFGEYFRYQDYFLSKSHAYVRLKACGMKSC